MTFKSLTLSLATAVAAFLMVGMFVTEFTQPWIEFSLFLGIPAGLAAGAFTGAAVYLGLADDAPVRRRRIAWTFAGFGVGFLAMLILVNILLDAGMTLALIVAVAVGLLVAIVAYFRSTGVHGSESIDSSSDVD